ncbi:hypothetical protein QAD02_011441 [Eretmocerus hayati]|uniref:Uncharacterized protein n=1 Tax=Eretmocerus hayati TaxID=131215 RepID=A0ACC2NWG5_9HYME|nr:hypothetical protein QAD02_011441 [Eretmocerus hayati]
MENRRNAAEAPSDGARFLDLEAIKRRLISRGIPLPLWAYSILDDGTVKFARLHEHLCLVDVIFHVHRDMKIEVSTPKASSALRIGKLKCTSFDDFLAKIQVEYKELPGRCEGEGYGENRYSDVCEGFLPLGPDDEVDEDLEEYIYRNHVDAARCRGCKHTLRFVGPPNEKDNEEYWI